ncbi:MAG: lipid A deacylase LpxR family protein [Planctomycetota bacterium]
MRAILILLLVTVAARAESRAEAVEAAAALAKEQSREIRRSRYVGTLSLHFENDTFANNSDDNFTAGFGLTWTSAPIRRYGFRNVFRRLVEDYWSFLPQISNPEFKKQVQIHIGYELYTPTDISTPVPPPGEHPYASVFHIDFGVYAVREKSMHAYFIRTGLVGPATQGGRIQKWMHKSTGRESPEGWDSQHPNEPLFNLLYTYQRRLVRWIRGYGFGFDAAVNAGGIVGNYAVAVRGGLQARAGYGLPKNFERSSPLSIPEEVAGRYDRDRKRSFYLLLQATGAYAPYFMPSDGSAFQDSFSVSRDELSFRVIVGAALSIGRFEAAIRFVVYGSADEPPRANDDYGVVTVSWTF